MWWMILAILGCGVEEGAETGEAPEVGPSTYDCLEGGNHVPALDGYPLVTQCAEVDGSERCEPVGWVVVGAEVSILCDPGCTYTVRWVE